MMTDQASTILEDQDMGGNPTVPPMPTPAEPEPTPMAAWQERFATRPYTLRSGYTVLLRRVSFMQGILDGTLPNQVLNLVMFDVDPTDAEGDKSDQVKNLFETYLMIVARALIQPKLRLGPPGDFTNIEPKADRGEIGPWQLTPADVYELYGESIREVVPAGAIPFSWSAEH